MCHPPTLIGLVGASGAGKSTLADELEQMGYKRISMAKPLKDMLAVLGLSHHDLYGPQAHREQPMDLLCGKSPRHAMVTLGTEWARELIGPDLWVNAVQERIIDHRTKCALMRTYPGIVIDDIRFPNEWDMVARLGGELWGVRRPAMERKTRWFDRVQREDGIWRNIAATVCAALMGRRRIHPSEAFWPKAPVEAEFFNTGSHEDLAEQVRKHIQRLSSKPKGGATREGNEHVQQH